MIAHGGLRPRDRVVEVGAGTGKATALLAERGLHVLALEPSTPMAAVARARHAGNASVRIVETELERWTPPARPAERARAVISANAWHWIDPEVRYVQARAALVTGGTLAALWTFPDWSRCAVRDRLRDVYAEAAPSLGADFPMHPASRPTRLAGDWKAEIATSDGFGEPRVTAHDAGVPGAGSGALRRPACSI